MSFLDLFRSPNNQSQLVKKQAEKIKSMNETIEKSQKTITQLQASLAEVQLVLQALVQAQNMMAADMGNIYSSLRQVLESVAGPTDPFEKWALGSSWGDATGEDDDDDDGGSNGGNGGGWLN